MQPGIYILAAPQNITEILFGVVFFLIWIASAAMSQMAKQREKQRRERVRREIESGGKVQPPILSQPRQQPQPIRRTPAPRPAPARPVVRRPAPAPKRPAPQRVSAPPEVMMPDTPALPPPPVEIKAASTAAPTRHPPPATAASLNAWLKPATLRQQFILTELLQPPLALRDPDSSRLI